jgi:hypothetical protein
MATATHSITAPERTPTPSLIRALHNRFETNQTEFAQIEDAATKADSQHLAARANELEADTLRLAILTQVPDTWTDAAILQFHIRIEHDLQAMATTPDCDGERAKALRMAIDTMFDFIASETNFDLDHEAIGKSFQQACITTHYARRHRTGDMI